MNIVSVLAQLRATTPLVHCLTNTVVPQITANVLLAAGAAPAMIDLPEETGIFAGIASAVLINVGNGSSEQHAAQRVAASAAHEAGTPWVLDPVAVGTLPVRTTLARELLTLSPTAVRGNASEILGLAGAGAGGRGVDSTDPVEAAVDVARGLADEHGTVVAISGEVDVVVGASRTTRVHGGDPLMPLVIGTGCSLGALVAATLGATKELPCPHDAVVAAHVLFAAAGIVAGRDAKGPASFEIAWRDALYSLTPEEVASLVAVEEA